MEDKDKMTDHEYDGIRELDNDLPRWWLYMFYISIVIAVVYMFYYHVFDIGYLSADEYKKEMDPNYQRVKEADAKLLGVFHEYHSPYYNPGETTPASEAGDRGEYVELSAASDTMTYLALTEAAAIESGKKVYDKNCVQCHGKLGEGGIGPNLTDEYWLHGGDVTDIVKTIKYGFPAKGMVAWRGTIRPEQILEVSSYIKTIHGTNPPNAKGPQGDLVSE